MLRGAALADRAHAVPPPPRAPEPPPEPDDPQELLARAGAEAEALVAAAHEEARALRERARDEGFRAGREAGLAQAAGALEALGELVGAMEERGAARDAALADEATALAVEIAAKLVRAELAVRPDRVVDVLRGAIRRASDRTRLVARVHPDDLAVCRDAAPGLVERMGGIDRLQVVDDPRVGRGSCLLETVGGDVDATFESQLARVVDALRAPVDPALLDADDHVG